MHLTFSSLVVSFFVFVSVLVEVNAIDSIQQLANATVATSILVNQQSRVTPASPVFSNSIVFSNSERRNSEKQDNERREEEEEVKEEKSATSTQVRLAFAANTIDSTTDSTSIASLESLSHLVSTSVSTNIRTTTNALPAQVKEGEVFAVTSITPFIETTTFPSSLDAGNIQRTGSGSSSSVSTIEGQDEIGNPVEVVGNVSSTTTSSSSSFSSSSTTTAASSRLNRQYQLHKRKCT